MPVVLRQPILAIGLRSWAQALQLALEYRRQVRSLSVSFNDNPLGFLFRSAESHRGLPASYHYRCDSIDPGWQPG